VYRMYRMLSSVHLYIYRYIDETIGYHQCEFGCNRLASNKIFSIYQILVKNESTMRLYIGSSLNCKKSYDSIRRGVLYNILVELG
jgi:hypothetical protein